MKELTWTKILVNPITKKPLELNNQVLREGEDTFEIQEGVPVMLPQHSNQLALATQQHKQANSMFLYAEHYQTDAEAFDYFQDYEDGATIHEQQRLWQTILNEVPKTTAKVLDVGCGKAWVAQHLAPKGYEIFSMDISTVNPIKAIKKYPFSNHHGVVADVYNLPFLPNTFDVIIASEIIEHVPNPKTFMEALWTVLKPGGVLIITTPYNEKIAYSLCIHCNRPTPHHAHIHSFTKKAMLHLIPEPAKANAKLKTFSNKALLLLRTHVLLKYVPFSLWRLVDQLANKILKKPGRLMVRLMKI